MRHSNVPRQLLVVSTLRQPPPLLARFLRFAAWACILALAVLTLLPQEEMVRTGADGRLEHFVAYAGTTFVVGLAYGYRLPPVRLAVLLIVYAGVLEIGQNFSPGRTPAVIDFAAGALGVCAGVLAVKFWYARRTVPVAS